MSPPPFSSKWKVFRLSLIFRRLVLAVCRDMMRCAVDECSTELRRSAWQPAGGAAANVPAEA